MGDVRGVKQFEAINDFAGLTSSFPYIERPVGEIAVADLCQAASFDAYAAIRLLLDPAPSFYGHKEVVYTALCAWVISPNDLDSRLNSVALEIKLLLAKAEEKAEEFSDGDPIKTDLFARYLVAGPQFLRNIYHGLGGALLISESVDQYVISYELSPEHSTFYTLRKMLACCHFLVSQPEAGRKKTPSVNRAIAMVNQFADHQIASRSAIYARWSKSKNNVALIYAASTIEMEDGSLLDWLLAAAPIYEENAKDIGLWLGRARYVCEKVLSAMPQDENIYAENVKALADVQPIAFDYPSFSADELDRLAKLK